MTSVPPPQWLPPRAPGHPEPPERPELPAGVEPSRAALPGWRPWTAWVALLGAFAGALAGALVIGIVAALAGASFADPPPAVDITATIVQDACLVGSALLFANLAGKPRPWQFGLRPPARVRAAVGWVVLAYVGFVTFSAAWLALVGQTNASDDLPDQLGADKSTVALVAVCFLVAVVAPLAEEFFFRGFFFTALRNWHGTWPAALITGAVFGVIHGGSSPWAFLVPLAFLGVILCLLYVRTGSLYPCIALHCINNAIALGSSQHWSWQIPLLAVAALSVIATALWAVNRVAGGEAVAPTPA